jgi:parvulin-like peptidyl-prolyl isomerase
MILVVAFVIAAATDSVVIDRVAAVVDNSIVLASEVDAVMEQIENAMPIPAGVDAVAVRKERRGQILDTLIAEKLLEAEVRKLRIDVTDAEVDRALQGLMRENNLTEDTLKMALGRQGMTLVDFRAQKKKELTKMKIVQLKVRSRVSVTDEDVKTAQRQQERSTALLGFSKVRARHILYLVPQGEDGEVQKRKALQTRVKLERGADFAELAAAESEDPGSKARGGDLGAFGRGEMVPEFERVAFEAPIGKVVGPIRTTFGWHVIRVDEHVAEAAPDATAAAELVRNQLFSKELETQFEQYLDELRREAFIEKRL